jgi:hypothetical protein
MTVSTTVFRADYTGNGSTTAFTVPFYFIDPAHLVVYRTQISTGVVTTLTLNSDYTVSGTSVSTGGSITATVAPTSDQKISILRNIPLTQTTHYTTNDSFPSASHETALDTLCMQVQQVNEVTNRSFTLSPSTSGINTQFPAPVANYALGWDATATSLTNIASAAQIAAASTNATNAAASASAASASATSAASSAATVAASSALLATFSNRNRIINGNFDIWQRGTSFAVAQNTFTYCADRFRVSYNTGAVSVTRNAHTVANAAYGKYYKSVALTAANTTVIDQPIENVRTFAGQTVTFSFYANISSGSGQTVTIAATQYFGTGGSPSASVRTTTTAAAANTGFARYSVTLTLPSLSGKTVGTNGDDYLLIAAELPGGTYTFDTFGWQLEPGSTTTPFEYRPMAYELSLCKRYYQIIDNTSVWHGRTTTNLETSFFFPVEMRSAPTIDSSNCQAYSVYDAGGTLFNQSSFSGNYAGSGATAKGCMIALNNFTGLTTFRTYITSAVSSGRYAFSAEL